ncbi:MAG: hypothetical protein EHM24_31225, partial [Acidobacteria bacterium]
GGIDRPLEAPTVVRGVIDLVYREPVGWRIVDYKTTRIPAVGEAMLERYRPQLEQYRDAWRQATGEKVASADVVVLRGVVAGT